MSAPEIKGWCPGAHRPMMSGDGLVVRVRPQLGRISPAQAIGLADLAESHGNGMIELTSRANLQVRGVSEASYPDLMTGLHALGLVDDTAEAEARRNITLNPFHYSPFPSNRDMLHDQDWMAVHLAKALCRDDMPALPSKFGFVIDAGFRILHLDGISGDIRIENAWDDLIVRADGAELGLKVADEAEAVDVAIDMARWFVDSGGIGADGRGRMHRHLAAGARLPPHLAEDTAPSHKAQPVRPGFYGGGLCVGTAFGLLPAHLLRWLAGKLKFPICITPFRMLFLPLPLFSHQIRDNIDLITRADDPMLRVYGCTGAPGCPQAQVTTRPLAYDIAGLMPQDMKLHVSGCAKGCAHPGAASVTLVGRNGRFDLVRDGCAWDEPSRRGLTAEDVLDLMSDPDAL